MLDPADETVSCQMTYRTVLQNLFASHGDEEEFFGISGYVAKAQPILREFSETIKSIQTIAGSTTLEMGEQSNAVRLVGTGVLTGFP